MTGLCVIPARGGSKRIPSKNTMEFMGIPMICHSLNAAADSDLFSEIHVSTESEEIMAVAEDAGWKPRFQRPRDLADDHTPLIPVLQWVLDEFSRRGRTFDSVCLLMSCAPLLNSDDLRSAYGLYEKHDGKFPVLSAARYPVPVEWAYRLDAGEFLIPRQPAALTARSQDLTEAFYDAGMFAIFSTDLFADGSFKSDRPMLAHQLPAWRAVDIDTEEDLFLAEILARGIRSLHEDEDARERVGGTQNRSVPQ